MHGIGNEFVVLDGFASQEICNLQITPELARYLCDRRSGIGADQLLRVLPSLAVKADARMEIFNSDGSTAEMCGNGIRAAALYLFGPKSRLHSENPKLASRSRFVIETLAGQKTVQLRGENVQVDMGPPVLGGGFADGKGELLKLAAHEIRFFEVSMGNPHAVLFVEALQDAEVEALGPAIETHERFPQRSNVEFAQVIDANTIEVQVWERGAGRTLACGTGACAVAAAAIITGRVRSPVRIRLPGGDLRIEWNGNPESSLSMEGAAQELNRGEIELPRS